MVSTPAGLVPLLVADDNEAARETLGTLFNLAGYSVTPAVDGEDALALARRQTFAAVLLDLRMPKADGLAVLRALRQIHPPETLPIIMATANGESETVVRALELGANDYVTKPYDFPVLLARVRTHLAVKDATDRREELERRLAERNAELEAANRELKAANKRMRRDRDAAARIQAALLPPVDVVNGVRFAWAFHPCEELGGDGLNVLSLGERHVGLFLLDVSGHGVPAALLSVALRHVLDPGPGSSVLRRADFWSSGGRPAGPAEVLARLNKRFPWDPATEQFFTMIYGVLDTATGRLTYASAGHPGPVRITADGSAEALPAAGLPVGLGGDDYREHTVVLSPGDRLFLYTDGVADAVDAHGRPFGVGRLTAAADAGPGVSLAGAVAEVMAAVRGWEGGRPPADDQTILAVEYPG